jgi:TetR/AcrR family transcriptional regulator, cholesterol catabolism regulator
MAMSVHAAVSEIDFSMPASLTHATAQRIMTAAVDQFHERGFKGTSVRDITSACGLTPGSLYIYFDSKDALLRDVVRYADHFLEERTQQSLADLGDEDPIKVFVKLVEAYAWYLMEHQKIANVGAKYWQDLAAPEREVTQAVRRRVTSRFADAIERARRAGVIDAVPADEVRITAVALLGMLNGMLTWYAPDGRLSKAELADRMTELARRLIGADVPKRNTPRRKTSRE